jgi:hypothetical protein
LPNPKPTTINPKDSRYERGTTGGQVTFVEAVNAYKKALAESEAAEFS